MRYVNYVCCDIKMAQESWSLKEDGYLNVDLPSQNIIYHPALNIILVITRHGLVHVLDVNSGFILQTSSLSAKANGNIRCRYLEDQNKILFIDGQGIGVRSDYNGMLLLDTILQRRLKSSDDTVKLELLLSEAIMFQQSLKSIDLTGTDIHSEVLTEITEKITRAQSQPKNGIKAQKWNTVCLELKLSTLRAVAVRVVSELKRQNRHVPALAVAAGISARLSELAPRERMAACDRAAMYSEAKRRETFARWPHMDYKWALPEQMAQAGFYHQPNSSGDDRAMCFTCAVCLVSWERTDEPWSEHERHSPSCPFVKGEYTQNVPLSVTYATSPALDVAPRGHGGATLVSHTNVENLIAFGHSGGMVSVYNVAGKLRRTHCFYVTQDNSVIENTQNVLKRGNIVSLTSLCVVGERQRITTPQHKVCSHVKTEPNQTISQIRPSIICGITISPNSQLPTALPEESSLNQTCVDEEMDDEDNDATIVDEESPTVKALNDHNQQKSEQNEINPEELDSKMLYLAIYDFQYKSAACYDDETVYNKNDQNFMKKSSDILISKLYNNEEGKEEVDATPTSPGGGTKSSSIEPFVVCNDLSPKSYQNLIPQDTNSIFLPPDTGKTDETQPQQAQQHNGPRILQDISIFENNYLITDKDIDYSFTNGHQLDDSDRTEEFELIEPSTSSEKSISDHIADIKAKGEKYVTYSHAVQCIQLPEYCQNKNLEIFEIIPTKNGAHILVVLKQKDPTIIGKSMMLIYALNFSFRVVKVDEEPIMFREISAAEQPEEITLLPLFDSVGECAGSGSNSCVSSNVEGLAAMVCADGAVRLLDLATFEVSAAKMEGSRYVSLTYCNSLERLCVSTEAGPLHFFAILGPDNEFFEEKDEEELSIGSPIRPDSGGSQLLTNNFIIPSLESNFTQAVHTDKMDDETLLINASKAGDVNTFIGMLNCRSTLTAKELKLLHYFCQFDPTSASYCAVLPACWSEMQQCQRKSTQHMQGTSDSSGQHVRTWRLQTDATTWDEHVIELTLPWSACIGHVDLSFSLHTPCPSLPNIQVTLLKQHASGIGHRKFYNLITPTSRDHVPFTYDANAQNTETSGSNISMENPVLTDEYHRAHNVDILAGPINLSSCLDLSEQSGNVTLTSPKLLKARGRTLLVHIKALLDPTKDNANARKEEKYGSTAKKSRSVDPTTPKSGYSMPIKLAITKTGAIYSYPSPSLMNHTNPRKPVESYIGCDWLHEISFAIRTMKLTNLPNERQQRTALLESNHLITILCECACRSGKDRSRLVQALSLDILTWIARIRLGRHKSDLGVTLLHNIEPHLYGLVLACLIDGTRSIAHKVTKLLIVCIENGRNMLSTPISQQFDNAVLQALLRTSSSLGRVHSACGLRWFSMILQHVAFNANNGTIGAASECIALIQHAAQHLKTRSNPYHQLLRSRFGLYGTPFDPELLDTEPPVFHKSSSSPVTFASVVTGDSFQQASNSNSTNHPTNQTSDHFDLKDLFSMSNVNSNNSEPKTPTISHGPPNPLMSGTGPQIIQTPVPTSTTRFRGLVSNNYLKGLLETEPLYYTCAAASEGTRIEKVENNENKTSLMNGNPPHVTYTTTVTTHFNQLPEKYQNGNNIAVCPTAPPNGNNAMEFPKLDYDSFLTPPTPLLPGYSDSKNSKIEVSDIVDPDNGNGNLSENSDPEENEYYFYLYNKLKFGLRKQNEKEKPPEPLTLENNPWNTDDTEPKNPKKIKIDTSPIAWQQLLLAPPQHYLVIERMHSGARRFVVLDFGAPILLTDLLIPACNDLVSLSIDVWYQSEDIDCVRLATAGDIGNKCLVLSDLQPPPLCRYLKITTIGRYGMSTTRCKIPVGYFYGHAIVLPEDVYSYNIDSIIPDKDQIEALNNVLITLFEDINCRYTLACSKLRDLLEPFLLNDDPNTQHMHNYLKSNKGEKKIENSKIYTAYQECINFQHQLNIVRNIIKRLGSYIDQEELIIYENEANCLQQASTDKLTAICENMLEILLCIVHELDSSRTSPMLFKYFNENICEELFMSLCVGHDIKLQLSTATLLVRMCGLQPWWGNFLAETLTKLYSSHNRQIFPQDRVFIILAYLCRKSLFNGAQRTAIFDPILRTLCSLLQPLIKSQGLLVAAKTDLGLIGWLLLYLSLSLDSIKFDMEESSGFSSRWDWLTTDASVNRLPQNYSRSNPATAVDGYRKKLHKHFLQYKQQLHTLDYTQKHVQASQQALSVMSSQAANLSSKLEVALKQQEQFYKKINQLSNKHFEDFSHKRYKQYLDLANQKNGNGNRMPDHSTPIQESSPTSSVPKKLNYEHCLTVCRGLILLILNLDCSCNIDIFLLSCKTIARIIVSTKPSLTLQQLVTQQQLLQLLRLAVRNEGSQWISHAVTCLLQDMLESQKSSKNVPSQEDTYSQESNSDNDDIGWSGANINEESTLMDADVFQTMQLLIEQDQLQDVETAAAMLQTAANAHKTALIKQLATFAAKSGPQPLPSLPESDDSDYEEFTDCPTKKSNYKFGVIPVSSISTATDSRLEVGLDSKPEITLRKLAMLSSYHLPAAINGAVASPPEYIKGRYSEVWPDELLAPWQAIAINPTPELTSVSILTKCFDTLIFDMEFSMSVANVEKVLQLWIAMSSFLSENNTKTNNFNPSIIPGLVISPTSIAALIQTICNIPSMSLRAWTLTFQCLTLTSNLLFHGWNTVNDLEQSLNGLAGYIIKDPSFPQMLLRFFSGNGMALTEKRLAGPSVSQTLHYLLVRLQVRADVVATSSKLGGFFKNAMLKLLLQMLEPGTGPIATQQGPLDAQCEFIQTVSNLDFKNCDLSIINNILKNLGILVQSYVSRPEYVRNVSIAEQKNSQGNNFGNLFSSVLGTNANKHGKFVTYENLIISLLKFATKLIQIPLPYRDETPPNQSFDSAMNEAFTAIPAEPQNTSQTDESKAAESQRGSNNTGLNSSNSTSSTPTTPVPMKLPCVADNVLEDVSTMLRLSLVLNLCLESSLAMIAGAVPNHSITEIGEPATVGDALFQLLSNITKRCTKTDLLLRSVLEFLTISDRNSSIQEGTPHLSDPVLWWLLQVLSSEPVLQDFTKLGGVQLIAKHLVRCYHSAISNLQPATISQIMQYLSSGSGAQSSSIAYQGGTVNSKKMQQANLEQSEGLVNFAPLGVISSTSPTAQAADVLIQATIAPHRRARTPQWSYHFYPDESHVELTITLPAAILLREVQLQPHLSSLATCPSAIAIEVSRNGSSGLIPVCPPLATSGMSFIRMNLPSPEVVTTVLLRLYKPRDSTNIGLLQIRLLGTAAFGSNTKSSPSTPTTTTTDVFRDIQDEEMLSKSSLRWLRLLHQCFNLPALESDLSVLVVQEAALVEDLLETCCGVLLVPSQVTPVLIGGTSTLERVLLKLCLHDASLSFRAIKMLLDNSPAFLQMTSMMQQPTRAVETVCELLYKLCSIQDSNTCHRVTTVLLWLRSSAEKALTNSSELPPNASYIHCIASILWTAHTQSDNLVYDIKSLITKDLFESIYKWTTLQSKISLALKKALDALLCSFCVINDTFFHLLLFKMGVLIPNLSTDRGASVSDDQKGEGMTDENKQNVWGGELNWHSQLVLRDASSLMLTGSQLSTIATASSSNVAVHQLLDSGLPKLLTNMIFQFCTVCSDILKTVYSIDRKLEDLVEESFKDYQMMRLEHIVNILNFFADMCFEVNMRKWLGSTLGSVFWIPLLRLLCHDRSASQNRSILCSGNYYKLEDATIRFLTKCCSLCCPNQTLLAVCLCDVIEYQKVTPSGISGFTRRLILQLLLENEKIWVSIKADETIYRNINTPNFMVDFVPHPAYRVTNNHILLHLDINTTLGEIFEQYISFTFEDICNYISNSNTETQKESYNFGGSKDMKKDLWEVALDMTDQMSVAAGVTAKDKRLKDAKNLIWQSVPGTLNTHNRGIYFKNDGNPSVDEKITEKNRDKKYFKCDPLPYAALSHNVKLSQLLSELNTQVIKLSVVQNKDVNAVSERSSDSSQVTSTLHVFSRVGGLAILAQHLPLIYSENIRSNVPQSNNATSNAATEIQATESDWVKVGSGDDIHDDLEEYVPRGSSTPTRSSNTTPNVPPHSLAAFALFLRLPGYAEMLLRDYKKAQCLLRLVLGVTDDGEGGDIFQLPIAHSLPTLPFQVLRRLYDSTPVTTDDSHLLRRTSINCGVIHLLLVCLSVFTHQTQDDAVMQIPIKNPGNVPNGSGKNSKEGDKTHLYWAKGTGFGTGSTQQSWNVEQALMRQRSEEEHVTVLLQVLSSYINPCRRNSEEYTIEQTLPPKYESTEASLPPVFYDLLQQSCLLPVLCSYLRNDSVLDMARHIPLYRALLQLLRSIAMRRQLVSLLLPKSNQNGSEVSSNLCVVSLLTNMKLCVDTYASRLKINSKPASNSENGSPKVKYNKYSTSNITTEDTESDEGLALLIPDIQATADLVREVLQGTYHDELSGQNLDQDTSGGSKTQIQRSINQSLELRYLEVMKKLQFDTFEMIRECTEAEGGGYQFIVSYHFEANVKAAGDRSHPARVKRLAQEAVTLATSLPLSYSSSVFVRCDGDRLDVMKVLITGPADTPYANGCFELDVYFPPDYPQAPMMINLETTGRHTVRFNPNLYNDGKVCLSVLNTWHGRPEEKWNAQTSSFLQVLVSIQSLILVPEPYFNEPGYERSRGTQTGTQSSLEYNANIYQATVRWAMLEQIRNPCPCFKQVIHTHFWLKRHEISAQIERWITELETLSPDKRSAGTRASTRRVPAVSALALKHHYIQLYEELSRLKTPEGLEDLEEISTMKSLKTSLSSTSNTSTPTTIQSPSQPTVVVNETFPSLVFPITDSVPSSNSTSNTASSEVHYEIDTDIEMEKMVSKVCE